MLKRLNSQFLLLSLRYMWGEGLVENVIWGRVLAENVRIPSYGGGVWNCSKTVIWYLNVHLPQFQSVAFSC